ncbi:cytochrome c556 [Maritalea mobilis]|uniref:Cytochrome c556 n=1 Tax=Maritalea mobilis TaxID=483324 RepID=A0A4R6VKU3_9HYPH|nr:cytochrome c [Maritalea mobilis]TDQ63717.1 cytochrome c556 [Maritalea mobilis]
MKFKLFLAAATSVALAMGAVSSVSAQGDVIAERQQAMKDMGAALKAGKPGDVAPLAAKLKMLFPEGSTSADSEATDLIWQEWDEFVAIFDKLEADSMAGADARTLGGSCKECHDKYREQKG